MAIVTALGVAAAGVTAASAAGAFTPSPTQPNYGAPTAAQIAAIGPTLAANQKYGPGELALQQQLAFSGLFGTPASAGTPGSGGYWVNSATGARSASQPMTPGNPVANPHGGGVQVPGSAATPAPGWSFVPAVAATPGTPGGVGTIDLMRQAGPLLTGIQTQEQNQVAGAQIQDVSQLGPAARAAIAAYNPNAATTLDTLTKQANTQLNLNGQLDPWTAATMASNLSSAQGARGVGYSPSDAYDVAAYQTGGMEQRRAQNQTLAANTISANQGFYGDPFLQVLGRSSGITIPQTNYSANPAATVLPQGSSTGAINALSQLGFNSANQANIGGYNAQMAGVGALTGNNGTLAQLLQQLGAGNLFNSSSSGQGAGVQGVNFD